MSHMGLLFFRVQLEGAMPGRAETTGTSPPVRIPRESQEVHEGGSPRQSVREREKPAAGGGPPPTRGTWRRWRGGQGLLPHSNAAKLHFQDRPVMSPRDVVTAAAAPQVALCSAGSWARGGGAAPEGSPARASRSGSLRPFLSAVTKG